MISLFLGRTLVESLTTSFRIRNDKIRSELGWSPSRPRFAEEVRATVEALPA